MTTKSQKKKSSRQKREIKFPLEKQNLAIIAIGIAMLIIGYLMMSQNSVDGFVPTVLAPIILVTAYCIVLPYGLLKKPKDETKQSAVPETSEGKVS